MRVSRTFSCSVRRESDSGMGSHEFQCPGWKATNRLSEGLSPILWKGVQELPVAQVFWDDPSRLSHEQLLHLWFHLYDDGPLLGSLFQVGPPLSTRRSPEMSLLRGSKPWQHPGFQTASKGSSVDMERSSTEKMMVCGSLWWILFIFARQFSEPGNARGGQVPTKFQRWSFLRGWSIATRKAALGRRPLGSRISTPTWRPGERLHKRGVKNGPMIPGP